MFNTVQVGTPVIQQSASSPKGIRQNRRGHRLQATVKHKNTHVESRLEQSNTKEHTTNWQREGGDAVFKYTNNQGLTGCRWEQSGAGTHRIWKTGDKGECQKKKRGNDKTKTDNKNENWKHDLVLGVSCDTSLMLADIIWSDSSVIFVYRHKMCMCVCIFFFFSFFYTPFFQNWSLKMHLTLGSDHMVYNKLI